METHPNLWKLVLQVGSRQRQSLCLDLPCAQRFDHTAWWGPLSPCGWAHSFCLEEIGIIYGDNMNHSDRRHKLLKVFLIWSRQGVSSFLRMPNWFGQVVFCARAVKVVVRSSQFYFCIKDWCFTNGIKNTMYFEREEAHPSCFDDNVFPSESKFSLSYGRTSSLGRNGALLPTTFG